MKKRRILLPIFLLSAFVLGGCTTNKKQESSQDTTQYGVEIANKAALEGEWYVGENKDLNLNLTPEANPLAELGKNLTITSSDTSVVAVTGLGLTGLKVGTAKVTVDYHGVKAEVNANIQSADPRDKYGTTHEGTAADPFDNEDALLAAKSSKYNGEDFYVKGTIASFYHAPGARDDGYVSWFLEPAEGKTEQFEIYKCKKKVGTKTENLTDDDVWVGGLATAHGTFTEYKGQYETTEATFVSCEGEKPDPRQTIEKTFAEMLTANAALADGADTYDYFKFDAYVTKKSGSNYFLTATEGEALHEVDFDADHKYYDNAFEVYNASAAVAEKLLKNAFVTVTSIVKNYHGQAENLLALTADDIVVKTPGTDWDAPAPADKYYAVIDSPVAATPYKFGMFTSTGAAMFATGAYAGYDGETTSTYAEGADFELVAVAGGYNLKVTLSDSSVKYVNLVASTKYTNLKFEDEASTVFTYSNEFKTLIATVNGHNPTDNDGDYYMGTFGANTVVKVSNTSFLTAENYDKTQFPCHFLEEKDRPAATGIVLDPSDDFDLEQGKSQTITATIEPEHAAGEIEWSVDPADKGVSVEAGVVKAAADATVDAVVTVKAQIKGTEISNSVKVTVKESEGGGGGDPTEPVTIVPGDGTAVESSDFTITKGGVTVAVVGSTLTADQIRVFKSKTITISSDNAIASIVFTCTANGTAKYGPGSFGTGAPEGYTFEDSGPTGTWTGSSTSVQFTAANNQVRITQIVVTFAA